jgi:ABC-type bacteriocin/lantibiotic exporter with double-glycine peptidase domain
MYRQDAPLVLHGNGITCTFEGGDKIGIVGRTGSGKTTLNGALFRIVEPAGGKIIMICVLVWASFHKTQHFFMVP